jgi:hypothetical protein
VIPPSEQAWWKAGAVLGVTAAIGAGLTYDARRNLFPFSRRLFR